VRRVLPFALVMLLAEASLGLPPGPASIGYTALNLALLAAAVGCFFLPWDRLPSWMTVVMPLLVVAVVLTLVLAIGGSSSGVGIVILVPLVWTALYHRRWESVVVVGAVVLTELITSLTPVQITDAALLRRVVFWTLLGGLISFAAHDLREQLHRLLGQREATLRRTVALEAAAEELTSILDPDEVLTVATRLATDLVLPVGTAVHRARYFRVDGSTLTVVAQYDETGRTIVEPLPPDELSHLREVLGAGSVVHRPLDPGAARPREVGFDGSVGGTESVFVPVHLNGEIDGVLSVPMGADAISQELVDYCRAFGNLMELALDNANVHRTMEEQATTDALTGLPNRRAFDQLMANRPGRMQFSILAIDVDDLKIVNDTMGHQVGDAVLAHVARSLSPALRRGDLIARMGGDEFAVFLFEADERAAVEAAERMLAALDSPHAPPQSATVSIGIAAGNPDSDPLKVFAAADAAMYHAKRQGGGQYATAGRYGADGPHKSTVGPSPAVSP
jgi:diguanylate cyclase (GGDEF)-like protein